jgi:alkyl hydroperoxide reductase subunit AhpF
VQTLVQEIAGLSPKISPTLHDFYSDTKSATDLGVNRIPAIVIRGKSNRPMRYLGMPTGSQFPVLIETLVETSRDGTSLTLETIKQLKRIRDDVRLQVFVAPSCEHSPAVSRTAFRIAQQSNRIKTDVYEATEFPDLAQHFNITATPSIVVNETLVLEGTMDEATIVKLLLNVVEGKPIAGEKFAGGASTPLSFMQPQEGRVAGSGLIIPR